MPRHVAFLRAINVGGHVVKMDRLRRLFEGFGHSIANVETFIASGNVIFEAPSRNARALERAIAAGLGEALGYEVATFIRSPTQLAAIRKYEPFPLRLRGARTERDALYVGFLPEPPAPAAARALRACGTELEAFQVRGREAYWLLRGRFSDSKFSGARLEKILGMPATLRNVTTVSKLAAKYA